MCPPPCEAEGHGSDEEDDPLWKFALKVTAGDADKVSVSASRCHASSVEAFEFSAFKKLSPLLTVCLYRCSWLGGGGFTLGA
jgi:hypothetical protein